jgi:alkanesulfonate monooxygenase SsuD/methylene tetrahydromethanopterin reductase-like flavin-dependent oxidoreductase (luciferase family)
MVAANVIVADTDAEAQCLFSSVQQRLLDMIRGRPAVRSPRRSRTWTSSGRRRSAHRPSRCSRVQRLAHRQPCTPTSPKIVTRTAADELIVTSAVFDHAARLHSFDLLAEMRDVLRLEPDSIVCPR